MITLTRTYDTSITDENVQDIMDMAAYGGITYWAAEPSDRAFDNCPDHKTYTIFDATEKKVHYLSHNDIRKAVLAVIDQASPINSMIKGYILSAIENGDDTDGIDCGELDADAADVIVQYACFGELLYG